MRRAAVAATDYEHEQNAGTYSRVPLTTYLIGVRSPRQIESDLTLILLPSFTWYFHFFRFDFSVPF